MVGTGPVASNVQADIGLIFPESLDLVHKRVLQIQGPPEGEKEDAYVSYG